MDNEMNALVVGAGGFVGRYLIIDLVAQGYTTYATKLPPESIAGVDCSVYDLDIADESEIKVILEHVKPDVIFHLAAVSSVAQSWQFIKKTFEVNVIGTINLLNGIREICRSARVVLIGSSEEYGFTAATKMPVCEYSAVNPANPYAISKLSQTYLGKMYAEVFDMNIIMMRAFNHIGPGQPTGFVVPDFCRQIAEIEVHRIPPVIRTGNLSIKRDFTDVRDVTSGYLLCSKYGQTGQIYNIGSGHPIAIGDILNRLIALSPEKITVVTDPGKIRPIDVPIVAADITRITRDTGWASSITIEQSLTDTLDYWRNLM